MYRSPNSTIDSNDLLNQTIEDVSKIKGELLLLGDSNYPNILLNVSHTSEHCASKCFTATQNSFLHQHVSTETHSRPNQRSTLIDLIFTLDDQSITKLIYTSPLGKSHHKILKFNYLVKCSLNRDKMHYLYEAANFNGMKNGLRFIDWPQILDSCDTISCWERFLNTINPVISKYTPTQKPNSSKRLIWMYKDALSKLKLKSRSYHRYLRTNDQQDCKT